MMQFMPSTGPGDCPGIGRLLSGCAQTAAGLFLRIATFAPSVATLRKSVAGQRKLRLVLAQGTDRGPDACRMEEFRSSATHYTRRFLRHLKMA